LVLRCPLPGTAEDRIRARKEKGYYAFGSRWDPDNVGRTDKHTGTDWPAQVGAKVFAAEAGKVVKVGMVGEQHPEWAEYVLIDHGAYTTCYMHINPSVSIGESPTKGNAIGTIADIKKWPIHLHFHVRYAPYDPSRSSKGNLTPDKFPEKFIDPETDIQYEASPTAGEIAPAPVTLTLYVQDGSAAGPVLAGARVVGQDGAGKAFDQTTNASGYVTLTGAPGTWQFTASKSGWRSISWGQAITARGIKQAFLLK
jgi:hypothetical protein